MPFPASPRSTLTSKPPRKYQHRRPNPRAVLQTQTNLLPRAAAALDAPRRRGAPALLGELLGVVRERVGRVVVEQLVRVVRGWAGGEEAAGGLGEEPQGEADQGGVADGGGWEFCGLGGGGLAW